ncbi:putative DNA-binding transcriptional regulator YafY [Kineothrix alysoides]|uniref:Putative DNA-binding transcriptional regulator YafY n=1 Tax=Kineothrix alysoides TaxID=1469948 RepID=A0A4R1QMT1_9FIRM|nr:YafY family protein [Kineothrix alysoides]TCL54263.1 putative DNA-binding transcriptional regulator YafY [Kineothrix alysoides]
MQINRLFEIIYILLDKKTVTAAELAEHFEVSPRTIFRDIDTLSQAGIPIYAMKGKGGGIRLTENYVLNKSVLTPKEQQMIMQALHGMNAVREEEIRPALSKLSALFGGEQEDWIEIEFSSWNSDDGVSRRFVILKEAIFAHKRVTFIYSGANGTSSRRFAEPLKLVFRASSWYLYAWCMDKADFRFFKLSRMEEPWVLEEYFERRNPPIVRGNPDLKDTPDLQGESALQYTGYSQNSSNVNSETSAIGTKNIYADKIITVTAIISANKAYRILDEMDKKDVEKLANGNYKVQMLMPENDWMYQHLLTFGSDMKVLKPERVREKLIKKLKNAIKQYEI